MPVSNVILIRSIVFKVLSAQTTYLPYSNKVRRVIRMYDGFIKKITLFSILIGIKNLLTITHLKCSTYFVTFAFSMYSIA